MISNLTETTMCLIEETGDSTHERTGRGSWGLPPPPLPPPPKFWATQIFLGSKRNFGKTNFCKSFHVSFTSSFFFFSKRWLTSSQFELREAWALWETPSRSLQDFVGDHVQRQTQLTSESHHRMNTYYASIDMVLTELQPRFREKEQEIICALGNICYSETPNKESFFRVPKFYKIDDQIPET